MPAKYSYCKMEVKIDMATIRERNDSYNVIYSYTDEEGRRRQKWETFKTLADAKKRKKEIEYKKSVGTFTVPQCKTLGELLNEYIDVYGKNKWALSTYQSNTALVDHYIRPILGQTQISDISPRLLERYYQKLLKTNAVHNNALNPKDRLISPHTVHDVHKLLRSCFNQAIKWELIEKNPADNAMVPKVVSAKREIWTAETLFRALKLCEDPRLALALNLSFCCSLRMGEMLGLTWDCVDISPESIKNNTPAVSITKELQRVSREILDELEEKDVQFTFPVQSPNAATVLVLKRPKTESSIRKVFMPRAVAEMLVSWKAMQEAKRKELDMEYKNYDLVFTGELGYPLEGNTLGKALRRLIKENDLPPVVFHSFRHASVTYKLKLNGGDIKSVQGDTGHAQANMVTEVYSHILDDSRQNNALLFQQAFYERQKTDAEEAITSKLPDGLSAEKLAKLLAKPEVKSVLMALAGSLEES